MNEMLSVTDLSYSYHCLEGETLAVDNLSFQINEGEFLAIVGPSGCGKSTLLSLIAGLITPDSGQIHFAQNHRELTLGYMLQKDHLLEWRTTRKNAALGLEINKKVSEQNFMLLDKMMENYGLISFGNSKPNGLSGGMRQRAALIRTLVMAPDLLLLDEPFSALDYQTRLEVSDDIWKILRKENKTAILITHDIAEAISMSDRVLVLSKRPAKVISEFPIQLSTSSGPFAARSAPEFQTYFNLIWEALTK